jgi:hypothetical protein
MGENTFCGEAELDSEVVLESGFELNFPRAIWATKY